MCVCVQVYHLRALNEVERQRWVTALELAKAKAVKTLDSGQLLSPLTHTLAHTLTHSPTHPPTHPPTEDESDGEEDRGGGLGDNILSAMRAKVRELISASEVISKTR